MVAGRRVVVVVASLGLLGACPKPPLPSSQDDEGASESSGDGEASSSESESGELPPDLGETGEPEPWCSKSDYLACYDAELGAWSTCLAECLAAGQRCIEADCEAACEPARVAAQASCAEGCPNVDQQIVCDDHCNHARAACLATGCDANDCQYTRYTCMWTNCYCVPAHLDYAWAGSCEIALPGPPVPFSLPYTTIFIGEQELYVDPNASGCDAPEVDAVFEQRPPEAITLCEPACLAFAELGSAEVLLGSPPCE